MADENLKTSVKLKSHPVKREDDSYHYHKKIHRDHSDPLPKPPTPKISGLDSSKSPKPPLPSSSSKPVNLIKKTKEIGICSSSKTGIVSNPKKIIDDVKHKLHVKEQVKTLAASPSKVKQEVSTSTPKKKTSSGNAKDKKVYSLPGQKHDPPEERDPLRIFYESLYEQIPTSEMAIIWMMEHGLLPPETAKKAYERKQKKQQQQRTGTPIKSSSAAEKKNSPVPEMKYSSISEKKRSFNGDSKGNTSLVKKSLSYDDDDDDDFVTKPAKKKVC